MHARPFHLSDEFPVVHHLAFFTFGATMSATVATVGAVGAVVAVPRLITLCDNRKMVYIVSGGAI